MVANDRKRYFHIDKNASSEQIYALLDDVESADEDDIDNLMNDSDAEFKKKFDLKLNKKLHNQLIHRTLLWLIFTYCLVTISQGENKIKKKEH